jgi:hypothetical protein
LRINRVTCLLRLSFREYYSMSYVVTEAFCKACDDSMDPIHAKMVDRKSFIIHTTSNHGTGSYFVIP